MKTFLFMVAACCVQLCYQAQTKHTLRDGMYLVAAIITDSTAQLKPGKDQAVVLFNPLFFENAPEGAKGLLLNTADVVPLELAEEPHLLPDTDKKKKLELTFSSLAADKLATFTSNNLMKQATLVVNGQALTLHKIRSAITGGKLQITRCDDNACEQIYVQLKDRVKK